MTKFQLTKIKDVVQKIADNRGKNPPYYSDEGIPIIDNFMIKNNKYINLYEAKRFLDETVYDNFIRTYINKGDILITLVGNGFGNVSLAPDIKSAIVQNTIALKINDKKIDNEYLYYYLKLYRGKVLNLNRGAAQPSIKVSDLMSIQIELPDLENQKKIVKILSIYDDLIKNNLDKIKHLRKTSNLMFKNFFLNKTKDGKSLEFYKKKNIPKGWKEKDISSLVSLYIGGGWGNDLITDIFSKPAYVIRGTDIYDIMNGSIDEIPFRFHKLSNFQSRKLQYKDIIFEVSGGSRTEGVGKSLIVSKNLLHRLNDDVICASFCKLVRPKKEYFANYLYLLFNFLRESTALEVFEIRSASSIVNFNWEAFIKFQKIVVPDEETLINFDSKVEVIISNIEILNHQIMHLKEARDIFLTRLLTGIIDVNKIKI
jgi:type I restriction enzyme S subunit